MPINLKAALYVRSAPGEEDPTRIYQHKALNVLAEERGWDVEAIYLDDGFSVLQTDERPQRKALMRHLRRYDVVAVLRLDRVARDLHELMDLLAICRKKRCALITHDEGIDTSTPAGRAVISFAEAALRMEVHLNSERARVGAMGAKKRGIKLGRPQARVPAARVLEVYRKTESYKKTSRILKIAVGTAYARVQEALETEEVEAAREAELQAYLDGEGPMPSAAEA